MSSVIPIHEDNVVYEANHRLMKCPKCREWNRVEHQRLIDKILVVACRKGATSMHESLGKPS